MEIAILPKGGLKIKGKTSTLIIDPQEKIEANAALIFAKEPNGKGLEEAGVTIAGPGEYETGGTKISGLRAESDMIYQMTVDGVSVLLGRIKSLEKMHQKLKESNILLVYADEEADVAFLTGLVTNVIAFYGEKSKEVGKTFGQENVKHMPKYVTTADKLPAEVETVILE